ncbi:J domain-containing protein [Spirillospora sp. CA-294931]|uniref:J domain-containing protein n=1 Tax=Spirillospora sp. CA-294931 TaxID=3240042 RepID=UPI003D8C3B99
MPAPFRDLDGHDAYELLGVAQDATSAEIGKARRRAVRDVHPDHHGDADAEDRTRLVNLAHHVLTKERAAYDAFRAGPALQEEPEEILDPWDEADEGVAGDPWESAATSGVSTSTPPPPPPPQVIHIHHYRERPARRRSRAALAIAVVVVVGLVALGSVAVSAGKRIGAQNDERRAKTAVPETFAGTWSGELKDAKGKTTRKIRVTLWRGEEVGGVEYPGKGGCSATLVPTRFADERLTLRERDGTKGCGDATVVATRKKNRLRLVFQPGGATADLKKEK